MSIHVALSHVTHYRYDRPVRLTPQIVRLRPAPHCRTKILSYSQRVTPSEHFINWQQDPQANYLARLAFPEPARELRIEIDLVAEMAIVNPFDFFLEPDAEQLPFAYSAEQRHGLQPYLLPNPATPLLAKYLASIPRTRRRTIDALVALNLRLNRDIRYLIRLDPGVQSPEETLSLASGSCRDTTWLLVQLLRQLGLAARFVSGYLIQLTADIKAIDGPVGAERDFTDLHAWCEVYLPGAGWIGLDPTSGLLAGEGHIPLACTPEPSSAAPLTGGVEDCKVEFEHTMSVRRIHEAPRVTLPYTDDQWSAILSLGDAVDASLREADVRLTMGGEPTFVAVTDRDEDEWNTAALGPTKRLRATELLWRLRTHFGRHGVVHFGQGKWYPGEQLPRWALGCYWRADGEPVWNDTSLFADEAKPEGRTADDARRFLAELAAELGLDDRHVLAGHEDVWYYLWRERRLPSNVDPFDARLDDEMERDRLARVFTQGLAEVVGYALPLAPPSDLESDWETGPWFVRGERMYLIPGDSPMGFRLPLDSLPWAAAGDRRTDPPLDPLARRSPLPPHAEWRASADPLLQPQDLRGDFPADDNFGSKDLRGISRGKDLRGMSDPSPVRTAVCAEARGGTLYIFMPPTGHLEHYLELVAAVEAAAASLRVRVVLEGYPPPSDPRLPHFLITPDPGVIEVNIQPGRDWRALVDQTTILYEEARQVGLTSEKFMLDGRHTGTGGGNHLVLGGPTAADSPFLRRPDLLRSLVSYWHNHPSLSYLFSGLFIGPTSQAPRVDEARHDALYELGIAFDQLPPAGSDVPPWLVDRALRHLLVDATGNTHRAEFCIDKLYSPDSSSGRRGLLELRAFEMPPHSRMSLAQQLLLRALVARFWRYLYTTPLVRWGTALHDRFMLPYFVQLDFDDVIEELRRAGYPLEAAWFAPHLAFRFPEIGQVAASAVHLTLRQALEPWHVLGEEGAVGGTTRFVDSSVERLEARVTGLTTDRLVVTCNGRALPLHPTGRNGEFVAGVRFRAWQPPSCLHPMIPVHAPLTFDVVDTWLGQSIAGCQYHVMHPGGRNYDQFPVNSYEAEGRRRARFTTLARTPGRVVAPEAIRTDEFPYTLDLRTR